MKNRIIYPIAFGLILFGCNNTTNNKEVTQKETIVTEEIHQHDEVEAIVLDNGKKWVVVPEMMVFIKNIENAVAEFSKKETASLEEYQNLSKLIAKNLEELTSNCTMTGQAHDELHKWLVPFLDLSAEFAETTNVKEAEIAYKKIEESFKEFVVYFE
jgi:hypothetical protein